MRTNIIYTLFVLTFFNVVNAQEHFDTDIRSRVKQMLEKSNEYTQTDSSKAIATVNSAMELSKEKNYTEGVASAMKQLGTIYKKFGLNEAGRDYLLKSWKIFSDLKYDDEIIATSQLLIDHYSSVGDYDNVRNFSFEKIAIYRAGGDSVSTGKVFMDMGWTDVLRSNIQSATQNYISALEIFRSVQAERSIAECSIRLGNMYSFTGEFSKANDLVKKAINYYSQSGDSVNLAKSLSVYGVILRKQGDYQKSLLQFLRAKKILEESRDIAALANCNNSLGTLYRIQEKYPEAEQAFLEAIKQFNLHGMKRESGGACYNLAVVYRHQSDLTKAKKFIQQARDTYNNKSDTALQALYLEFDANISREQNELNDALEKFVEALSLRRAFRQKEETALAALSVANVLVQASANSKGTGHDSILIAAKKYLDESINLSQQEGYQKVLMDAYSTYSNVEFALGDHAIALDYYKKGIAIRDTINQLERRKQFEEIQTQYETAKKDKEIIQLSQRKNEMELELLKQNSRLEREQYQSLQKSQELQLLMNEKRIEEMELHRKNTEVQWHKSESERKSKANLLLVKESELQSAILSRQRILRNSLIAGIILILVIGLLVTNRYAIRQNQKHHNVLKRISSDLHDEIGSTLSSISMYSSYARSRPEEAALILDEISGSSQQMIEEMNDIIWAINPKNDSIMMMIDRLRGYASRMALSRSIRLDFENDEDFGDLKLNMERRKNFYLICKEAINNAVKYSECKNLQVKLNLKDKKLSALIKDFGKGFDISKVYDGNGLKNMRNRASQLGAEFTVYSNVDSGTSVNLGINLN